MRTGFFSMLFIGLTGYGIWLQQSYMSVYSQEFELQQKSSRPDAPFIRGNNFVMKEFKKGIVTTQMSGNEFRFFNNGNINIIGNLHYTTFNKDGSKQLDLRSPRMLGAMKPNDKGVVSLTSNNGLSFISFPQEVVAISHDDHITGSAVTYKIDNKAIESNNRIVWKGKNRNFEGVGFRYNVESGDMSVGGPIEGTFLPTKDDFAAIGERR